MQFVCRVGTPEGRVLEEVHQARNEASLRRELERIGYHIFQVRRRGRLGLGGVGTLETVSRKVPTRDLLVFNQELAALLRAGLPLLQAINLLLERQKEGVFRASLTETRDAVEAGESLSAAVAAQDDIYPALYAPTLAAGERSGDLADVLDRFVRYQRLVLDARKRIVSALVYPAVLLGLSMLLVAVMLLFVVPGFESFFGDLGSELPLITRVIVAISHALTAYWAWWLGGIVVLVLSTLRAAGTARGATWIDRLKLRLPFLGTVMHKFGLGEFCRSLSTLLSGGTPLVGAIDLASGAVGNTHLRQLLQPIAGQVSEGISFHETLERTGTFPDLAVDMVKVGEATGALATMLATVSDFLDEEVETALQRILSLIEPLMLVIMGVVIGTLLISVYLPLSTALNTVS